MDSIKHPETIFEKKKEGKRKRVEEGTITKERQKSKCTLVYDQN